MSVSPVDHVISLMTRFSGNMEELRELVNTLVMRVDRMEAAPPAAARKRARTEGDEGDDEEEEDDFQLGVAYATFYKGQHVPPPVQQSWPALVEAITAELARKTKAMEDSLWAKHQANGQINVLKQERDMIATQLVEYQGRVDQEHRLAVRAREEATAAREAVDAMRKRVDEADRQRALDAREQERELQRLRRACDGHEIEMAKLREEMSREAIKAVHQYTADISAAKERTVRHDAHRDKRISELEREIARLRMIAAIGVHPPQPTQPPIIAPQQQRHRQPPAQAPPVENFGEDIDLHSLDFEQLRADIAVEPGSPTYSPSPIQARLSE